MKVTQSTVAGEPFGCLLLMGSLLDKRPVEKDQVPAVAATHGDCVGGDFAGHWGGRRDFFAVQHGLNLFRSGNFRLFNAVNDAVDGSHLPILLAAERANKAVGDRGVKEFGELTDG